MGEVRKLASQFTNQRFVFIHYSHNLTHTKRKYLVHFTTKLISTLLKSIKKHIYSQMVVKILSPVPLKNFFKSDCLQCLNLIGTVSNFSSNVLQTKVKARCCGTVPKLTCPCWQHRHWDYKLVGCALKIKESLFSLLFSCLTFRPKNSRLGANLLNIKIKIPPNEVKHLRSVIY